jgi:hypothetical protein
MQSGSRSDAFQRVERCAAFHRALNIGGAGLFAQHFLKQEGVLIIIFDQEDMRAVCESTHQSSPKHPHKP